MNGFRLLAIIVATALASPSYAQIYRWDNGQVIPGTEGIAPGPGVDFRDWNSEEKNLQFADLTSQILHSASFVRSQLDQARFDSSDLANADFTNADLRGVTFYQSNISVAVFSSARIQGVTFPAWGPDGVGLSREQLYSTHSYLDRDLSGVVLIGYDLTEWNFHGQNLIGAILGGCFRTCVGSTLADADISFADMRGATLGSTQLSDANLRNTIRPNGVVVGLELVESERLTVRNLHVHPGPLGIQLIENATVASGAFLQLRFDADPWDSLISFEPDISVQLGGTLELTFTDEVDVTMQVGRTLDLFDWTGVSPVGHFHVVSPYNWDLTDLYSTGEVTLLGVPEPSMLIVALALLLPFVGRYRRLLESWR